MMALSSVAPVLVRASVRLSVRCRQSARGFAAKAAKDAAKGGQRWVDLRSDTVTLPSNKMRQAMAAAEVGDDVMQEDPTVLALQTATAKLLGKEAGLFVPSGTQGNLISVAAHCGRGTEVILGSESHIFRYEQGGVSAFMGVSMFQLPNQVDGTLDLAQIEGAVRDDDPHCPITACIALENTQNRCGGKVLKPDYMAKVAKLAKQYNLPVHLDGARLMNAVVALGCKPTELAQHVDTISLCLSKGLGAPVGSVIVGSKPFIAKALRLRKALGGGMRQAGVIAAAGLVALEENVERLAQDHENAKLLARGLAATPGITLDASSIETNIVYFHVSHPHIQAEEFTDRMLRLGVRMGCYGTTKVRAVTHLNVTTADIEYALECAKKVLA